MPGRRFWGQCLAQLGFVLLGASVTLLIAAPRSPDGPEVRETTTPVLAPVPKPARPTRAMAPAAPVRPAAEKARGASDAQVRDALASIRPDPAPKEITRGIHYVVSNEKKHYLWRPHVEHLGGIAIGVGAEQNYMLAGWARPEVLILMDFDGYIPWLHLAYAAAFHHAKTPAEMVALWRESGRRTLVELVEARYDRPTARNVKRAIKHAWSVGAHLARIRRDYRDRGIPCFLTAQNQYDHIRDLTRRGRVLAIRGDLTGERTMADIAAVSQELDLPVRVVYLSNAEYYFPFRAGRYRDNMSGLPYDPRSLVLRTWPRRGNEYRYYEQRGVDFVTWLEHGTARDASALVKHAAVRSEGDDRILASLP